MKKTIIILSLVFFCCQSSTAQVETESPVTYVSPKKDTLIVPNDDLGNLIKSTWSDTPKHQQPVIITADISTIKKKNDAIGDFTKPKKIGRK